MTYGTVGGLHSVDADDGMIDGLIGGGFSASASTLFISGSSSVLLFEVQFDSAQLGYLPTAVGFVLTDGAGEGSGLGVYDRNDNGITFSTWDIDLNGTTTADDRFIGVINSDGISRIEFAKRIFHANPSAQPRIDHFQYGLLVPEPSAMDLMCAVVIFVGGFTVFGAWRRRHVLKGKLDD